MTEEQIRQYREAVAALVATCVQQLRDYPLPDEAPLEVPEGFHEANGHE